jgi:hypothetical protein
VTDLTLSKWCAHFILSNQLDAKSITPVSALVITQLGHAQTVTLGKVQTH